MSRKKRSPGPRGETGDTALCEYAATVIAPRLDKMLSHGEDVRKNEETEPVHQMRVWSRRSRAALELFRPCFAGKAYNAMEREVKAVTGALGQARDLDVMIETLGKRADGLPEAQRPGLEAFLDELRRQRKQSQKAVDKAVARLEQHAVARRFTDIAAKKGVSSTILEQETEQEHGENG